MYTDKCFYEFFPDFLPSSVQKRINEIINLEKLFKTERESVVSSYYNRHKEIIEESKDENGTPNSFFIDSKLRMEEYPKEEVDEVYEKFKYFELQEEKKHISNKFMAEFVEKNDVYKFKNAEEAFNKYVENAINIYAWSEATGQHKLKLAKEGKTPNEAYEVGFVSNYWHFMEWQSDLYPFGLVLLGLVKNKSSLNFGELTQKAIIALNYTCGIKDLSDITKSQLLNSIWHSVETAMAWAYEKEDNWIIKDVYPKTSQKDFEDHVNFLVSLYAFIESLDVPENFISNSEFEKNLSVSLPYFLLENYINNKFSLDNLSKLEDLPDYIENAVNLLVKWENSLSKLNLPDNMDYEENFESYQRKKREAIYQLGLSLWMLFSIKPQLPYFRNLGRFNALNSLIKSNGQTVFVYDKSFSGIFYSLTDNLKSALIYENPYGMSDFGENVLAYMLKLSEFGSSLRDDGLDFKDPNNYRKVKGGKKLDLDFIKKKIPLINKEDEIFLDNWQEKRRDKEKQFFAKLYKEAKGI